jgi:NitT/TauT family transport system substrate-binding protein
MTLPWLPLGTFSQSFVAQQMGFWKSRGLEVRIDRGFGSGKVCIPVDQGLYDFGIVDFASLLNCAARGVDIIAIAGLWPRSPVGIFSLQESRITSPKALEGQTVAFEAGSTDFQLWPAFVKATGIDDRKVTKLTLDADTLIKVLVQKQIKAEGNFFGSIAPSLWAQGLKINSLLYENFGIRTFSNVLACRRGTVERKPELCRAFVEGLMEGLRYVYLNPERSAQVHMDAVREFRDAGNTNRQVIEYGQAISTALGMVPAFKSQGLGFMDPQLLDDTVKIARTYLGVTNPPPVNTLFTNKFVGGVRLTDTEWTTVEQRSERYLPRRAAT